MRVELMIPKDHIINLYNQVKDLLNGDIYIRCDL